MRSYQMLGPELHQFFVEALTPEQRSTVIEALLKREKQDAVDFSYFMLCAALVSVQCQNAEGASSEGSKALRAKFGQDASALFQQIYNESVQADPLDLQKVITWTCYGVSVVLTSPGINDFQLDNLASWAERMVDQFDPTGDTFLGRVIYRKDVPRQKFADWCVQLYAGCTLDLIHLLGQFQHN